MSKAKKILIAVAAIVVALLVAADIAISSYLVNYAIGCAGDGGDRNVEEVVIEAEGTEARIEAERAAQAQETAEFLKAVPGEPVEVTAADGVHLAGIAYEHNEADNRWVIVIHGYRSSHESDSVLDMARHYYDAGFNVLTPDLCASGQGEGDYVGMGRLDRLDILDWVDWILAQNVDARIVIHGASMSAATMMMAAGEKTSDAVVAFVGDCGYTPVWDVFSSELPRRFGLPEFPLFCSVSVLSDLAVGYSFEEASVLEVVARSEKSMLFTHGTADDFIPFDMMGWLYDAKTTGDKEMLVSEGADHVEAMCELGGAYWGTVLGFVNRYAG